MSNKAAAKKYVSASALAIISYCFLLFLFCIDSIAVRWKHDFSNPDLVFSEPKNKLPAKKYFVAPQ